MNKLKKILSILLVTIILGSFASCTQPEEHTTKFSAIDKEWTLGSIYYDSKSIKQDNKKTDVVITKDTMTVTVTTKKGKKDKEDKQKVTTYTLTNVDDGKFTATSGSTVIEYTFQYDPGAELFHLYYTDKKGRLVHSIYGEYTEAIPWDDGKAKVTTTDTNSNSKAEVKSDTSTTDETK